MSSNEGRKWGSGHQQAVKTELSLQPIQLFVSIALKLASACKRSVPC